MITKVTPAIALEYLDCYVTVTTSNEAFPSLSGRLESISKNSVCINGYYILYTSIETIVKLSEDKND